LEAVDAGGAVIMMIQPSATTTGGKQAKTRPAGVFEEVCVISIPP
jgi:hypothetical protein